jgi:hypothetical protein
MCCRLPPIEILFIQGVIQVIRCMTTKRYRRTQGAGWQPQFSGLGRPMGWLHQGYLFFRIQFYQLSILLRSSLHFHKCENKSAAVF